MRRDHTGSHVGEWADLVGADVPESVREDDDEDGDRYPS
jgi:hypothetical protein